MIRNRTNIQIWCAGEAIARKGLDHGREEVSAGLCSMSQNATKARAPSMITPSNAVLNIRSAGSAAPIVAVGERATRWFSQNRLADDECLRRGRNMNCRATSNPRGSVRRRTIRLSRQKRNRRRADFAHRWRSQLPPAPARQVWPIAWREGITASPLSRILGSGHHRLSPVSPPPIHCSRSTVAPSTIPARTPQPAVQRGRVRPVCIPRRNLPIAPVDGSFFSPDTR